MAALLQSLSTVSFILAVLLFALGVALFFAFRMRSVIGELTGKTATNEIAKIREQGVGRQHKGRSLQSIVSAAGSGSGSMDFSLEQLSKKPDTGSLLSGQAERENEHQLEIETSFLSADSMGEQETSFLSADSLLDTETSYLSADSSGEQ
jgi:hypothetical protein